MDLPSHIPRSLRVIHLVKFVIKYEPEYFAVIKLLSHVNIKLSSL